MGTEAETRALDLLDKLQDCGLDGGLTEEDFSPAAPPREPLRTACADMARQVWALRDALSVASLTKLQAGVLAVLTAAESEAAARGGALDAALCSLAAALDPEREAASSGAGLLKRLGAAESIVEHLQAAAVLTRAAAQTPTTAADTVPGATADAATVEGSRALRALGRLLGADLGVRSAAALANECAALTVAETARLPAGFFEPVLEAASDAVAAGGEGLHAALERVDAALRAEYRLRRRMLRERAGLTAQALLWSDRLAVDEREALEGRTERALAAMADEPQGVGPAHVESVRLADVYAIMNAATSRDETAADLAVKRIVIGAVPDRGGRVGESRAAAMPTWAARRAAKGNRPQGQQHRPKRLKKQHA